MNENPQLPAYVRTYIPILVGAIAAWLIKRGYNIDSGLLTAVVTVALSAGYYALIRALESHHANFGWLLGIAKQPAYASGPAPAPDTGEDVTATVEPDFNEAAAAEATANLHAQLDGGAPPAEGD